MTTELPSPPSPEDGSPPPALDLTVRVGCEIAYECPAETPALITFRPRHERWQSIREERVRLEPELPTTEFEDDHGNSVYRTVLQPGANVLHFDAIAQVPSAPEDFLHVDEPIPPHLLPASLLRYTLPTRYADSDKLLDFAWQHFGGLPHGLTRVRTIVDWVHRNVEYRTGSGSPQISAWDVIQRGYGVCRDLAHCVVALCRTFNLPARYVSGYVPDIGVVDPGTPMDFHAYAEVYLGGHWQTFDARFNRPRIGRIRIAAGYDAGSTAFSTLYGAAVLTKFVVWSYQIAPGTVRVGDPIDLDLRLCGTEDVRLTA